MLKRITYWVLCFVPLPLLAGGIAAYRLQQEFLAENGLDGMVFIVLIMLGLMLLLNPVTLGARWEEKTAVALIIQFLTVLGGMILVLGGLFAAFALFAFILSLPERAGRPYALLPLLILGSPLVATIVDMVRGDVRFTPRNLGLSYLLYAYRLYFLLVIQLVGVTAMFALFPAGFFLQFISIVGFVVELFSQTGELPVLCNWFNVGANNCTAALFGFHLGHPLLVALGLYIYDRWFDRSIDWFYANMTQMAAWLDE